MPQARGDHLDISANGVALFAELPLNSGDLAGDVGIGGTVAWPVIGLSSDNSMHMRQGRRWED